MDSTITHTETHYHQLIDKIASPNRREVIESTEQLQKAGVDSLPAIKQRLTDDPNWKIRRFCAGFLDHFADDTCEKGIAHALIDGNSDVRRIALHSLSCQKCKPAPLSFDINAMLLARVINDPSVRVRRVALLSLKGRPYDDRLIPAMEDLLPRERDRRVVECARQVLKKQRRLALQQLLRERRHELSFVANKPN